MTLPVIFIGHGSPMYARKKNPFSQQWQALGKRIKPKAILMISAHWFTRHTYIQNDEYPSVINDIYGLEKTLPQANYRVKGDAILSRTLLERLTVPVEVNNNWGIDYGTWSVLNHMYPNMDIPVVQLSVHSGLSPSEKYKIGQQLRGLRNEGVLIIGSGNIVHNLSKMDTNREEPFPWAEKFNNFIRSAILESNHEKCLYYYRLENAAHLSVPISDHFDPLLYVLGATLKDDQVTVFNDELLFGSLSMTSYIFE